MGIQANVWRWSEVKGWTLQLVGVPALYLARTIEGCFLEQAHGFPLRFDPLTVCTYDLDIEGIVDLTNEPHVAKSTFNFLELTMLVGGRHGSWKRTSLLKIARTADRRRRFRDYCAFARGAWPDMHNVVLWRWGPDLPHRVLVHDPSGRLSRKANCPRHDVVGRSNAFDPYFDRLDRWCGKIFPARAAPMVEF